MVATKFELCADWLYYGSLATQFLSHCAQFYNSIPIASLLLNSVFQIQSYSSRKYRVKLLQISGHRIFLNWSIQSLIFCVSVYKHLISCIEDAWLLDLQPAALQPMHNKPYLGPRRHIAAFFLGAIDSSSALCLRAVSNNEVINNNTKMKKKKKPHKHKTKTHLALNKPQGEHYSLRVGSWDKKAEWLLVQPHWVTHICSAAHKRLWNHHNYLYWSYTYIVASGCVYTCRIHEHFFLHVKLITKKCLLYRIGNYIQYFVITYDEK